MITIEGIREQGQVLAQGATVKDAIAAYQKQLPSFVKVVGAARMDAFRTALKGEMGPAMPAPIEAIVLGASYDEICKEMGWVA